MPIDMSFSSRFPRCHGATNRAQSLKMRPIMHACWHSVPLDNRRQGPLPEGAPAIVVHALSIYCKSALGSSLIYADLARALKDWEST